MTTLDSTTANPHPDDPIQAVLGKEIARAAATPGAITDVVTLARHAFEAMAKEDVAEVEIKFSGQGGFDMKVTYSFESDGNLMFGELALNVGHLNTAASLLQSVGT